MRLDRRSGIVILVSLLWGLAVAFVFHRLVDASRNRVRPAAEKSLVVACRPLPFGAVIGRDAVKLKSIPVALFPVGGEAHIEDVLDRPVISPIQAEEPVVEARLAQRGSGLGLAPLIPTGMRAIAVRVNDVAGVAGFILPGMRVDVLVTGRPPGRSDTFTRTVLQNILVLSAGQTIQTDGKNPSINVPVVTLLVNPGQAEALTLAYSEAHIQLVLRNSGDDRETGTPGSQTERLFGVPVEAAPRPAPPPRPRPEKVAAAPPALPSPPLLRQTAAPAPSPNQVVMIRGNVKTVEPAQPGRGETK